MIVAATGQSGLLVSTLYDIDNSIVRLGSVDNDIRSSSIKKKLHKLNPDIIIHAGASTNSVSINQNPIEAIRTNIIGSAHISEYCIANHKRVVYISTDYVYPGLVGNYKESDPILPNNDYAWTKLGGECSIRLVPNHLIIRTSFGASNFPYDVAWGNQIVSKDYVDVIAPMIYKAALSKVVGILNIGTEPKSLYDYAAKRNNIKKSQLNNKKDFSLNLEKYEQSFNN